MIALAVIGWVVIGLLVAGALWNLWDAMGP